MITIVNYGLGNIQAFANIYKRLNIPFSIATSADELAGTAKIILPGVGAFDWAMSRLKESGMRDMLDELVLVKNKPVLGICVGMQMMAKSSDEGALEGLGWIDGEVKKLGVNSKESGVKLPHMGWNDVRPMRKESLFNGIDTSRFYFLHSYFLVPNNPADVLSTTDYSGPFASAICVGNVLGVQFHPEKSHQWGIQLLKNFAEI